MRVEERRRGAHAGHCHHRREGALRPKAEVRHGSQGADPAFGLHGAWRPEGG